MAMTRRDFLKNAGLGSLAFFSAAATVPAWVSKSAQAATKNLNTRRKLVIVQLAGGNDGLNTVIPYQDPLYMGNQLRPNLHITSGYHVINELNALHPRLSRLAEWYMKGNLAIVQNVGYPNPNFSHFIATEFWERGTSPNSNLN